MAARKRRRQADGRFAKGSTSKPRKRSKAKRNPPAKGKGRARRNPPRITVRKLTSTIMTGIGDGLLITAGQVGTRGLSRSAVGAFSKDAAEPMSPWAETAVATGVATLVGLASGFIPMLSAGARRVLTASAFSIPVQHAAQELMKDSPESFITKNLSAYVGPAARVVRGQAMAAYVNGRGMSAYVGGRGRSLGMIAAPPRVGLSSRAALAFAD